MSIKKLGRFVVFAVILSVLFVMGGCGKKADDGKVKVGVAVASFDDLFLINMVDAMKAHAKETYADELEVVFVDSKDDAAKQLGQVENFITQGMDAVVIIPVDTDATGPMTKACIDNEVKVVYVNRKPGDLPEGSYYVGSDEISAGVMQMEYVAEKLNGEGNIVILVGKLDNEGARKRTEGVKSIADKFPGINVIKEQTGLWQRAMGMQIMENWIASGDQIDAVMANNDEMAIGAISAIEASGKLGEIIVAGVDATADALSVMDAGKLDVTIFQDGKGQGSGAINAAYNAVKGNPQDQFNWIPFKPVTPENYKEFMK